MSKAKRAGTAFETALVNYAQDWGWMGAQRLVQHGAQDIGDIELAPGIIIEAKATRSIDLAGAVDEAEVEANNYAEDRGMDLQDVIAVTVIKRRNHSIPEAYAVVPYDLMLNLLEAQR